MSVRGFCSFHHTGPDVKPMEMAFARLKALIRRAAARTHDDLWRIVGDVRDLFTEEECYNFFRATGHETHCAQHTVAHGLMPASSMARIRACPAVLPAPRVVPAG